VGSRHQQTMCLPTDGPYSPSPTIKLTRFVSEALSSVTLTLTRFRLEGANNDSLHAAQPLLIPSRDASTY